MPDIPIVTLEFAKFRTKKQEKFLSLLNSKPIQKGVNEILKDYINAYVPKKSGALRNSAKATSAYISWGEGIAQYARYQYYGIVYGPNLPGVQGGKAAWRSRSGQRKYPTGRELGKFGAAILRPVWGDKPLPKYMMYTFGYTTPGTSHHWDKKFGKKYSLWRSAANREVTRYLKKECKKAGIRT